MEKSIESFKLGGILLFQDNPRKYLVLFKNGRTDFPKGHAELGETILKSARRETTEETGLTQIALVDGFEHTMHWTKETKKRIKKKSGTFFLGRYTGDPIVLSDEHEGYEWLGPLELLERLDLELQKELLLTAEAFLSE